MAESVDVAIIGAGQAGLATSWYLKQAGVEHVVLESSRVPGTWRPRWWDSFCLVTPNWSVRLPGAEYAGSDPDGFMPLAELIDYFQHWADSYDAPVHTNSNVSSLEKNDGDFVLELADKKLRAHTVVVATGAYQRAHRPAGAEQPPPTLFHLLGEAYSNPTTLPPGGVPIVGSAQTGGQLAGVLHAAWRNGLLAC